MELTKYQKSYLSEYMWNVHKSDKDAHPGSGENTCWLHITKADGLIFQEAKRQLKYSDDVESIRVLIVASRGFERTVRAHAGDHERFK